ncbi:MAG: hypothetical protein WCJ81_08650 [bacterium]
MKVLNSTAGQSSLLFLILASESFSLLITLSDNAMVRLFILSGVSSFSRLVVVSLLNFFPLIWLSSICVLILLPNHSKSLPNERFSLARSVLMVFVLSHCNELSMVREIFSFESCSVFVLVLSMVLIGVILSILGVAISVMRGDFLIVFCRSLSLISRLTLSFHVLGPYSFTMPVTLFFHASMLGGVFIMLCNLSTDILFDVVVSRGVRGNNDSVPVHIFLEG